MAAMVMGTGTNRTLIRNARANSPKNSRCVSNGGRSRVTLYARKPVDGRASRAAKIADATLPAYTHDRWFVPGPRRGSTRRRIVAMTRRSEEHTSELQSQFHLVCRL